MSEKRKGKGKGKKETIGLILPFGSFAIGIRGVAKSRCLAESDRALVGKRGRTLYLYITRVQLSFSQSREAHSRYSWLGRYGEKESLSSPLLSRITVSLALVLGPSRGNSCQGPTIGRSSSHLINNPPTMSTPSDSQLINDRGIALPMMAVAPRTTRGSRVIHDPRSISPPIFLHFSLDEAE